MQSNKQNHNYCNDTVIMCHIYYFFMILFYFFKKNAVMWIVSVKT